MIKHYLLEEILVCEAKSYAKPTWNAVLLAPGGGQRGKKAAAKAAAKAADTLEIQYVASMMS